MQESSASKHGSVPIGRRLTGNAHPDPYLVLEANRPGHNPVASATTISLVDIPRIVIVPVRRTVQDCPLNQATADGWDRNLEPHSRPNTPPYFHLPTILSTRAAWHIRDGRIEVFAPSYVIDGARRLAAAYQLGKPSSIPAIVIFGLTSRDELSMRRQLHPTKPLQHRDDRSQGPALDDLLANVSKSPLPHTDQRIDTSTPRLTVPTAWITLTIESEPFVVPTGRGYAPAILVRRPRAAQRQHLLIGAKSLATPLEQLRLRYRFLTGQRITLRKTGIDKMSIYEVRQ